MPFKSKEFYEKQNAQQSALDTFLADKAAQRIQADTDEFNRIEAKRISAEAEAEKNKEWRKEHEARLQRLAREQGERYKSPLSKVTCKYCGEPVEECAVMHTINDGRDRCVRDIGTAKSNGVFTLDAYEQFTKEEISVNHAIQRGVIGASCEVETQDDLHNVRRAHLLQNTVHPLGT